MNNNLESLANYLTGYAMGALSDPERGPDVLKEEILKQLTFATKTYLAEIEKCREALQRLASNEAFYVSGRASEEDKMRIDFARQALERIKDEIFVIRNK